MRCNKNRWSREFCTYRFSDFVAKLRNIPETHMGFCCIIIKICCHKDCGCGARCFFRKYSKSEHKDTDNSLHHFNIEAEWSETVIAADHCAHGVLHPAIIEVPFTSCQRFHELPHGIPCSRTHPFRTFAILGNPLLSLFDIACVLDGILILFHQVWIDRLAYGSDSYFVHSLV